MEKIYSLSIIDAIAHEILSDITAKVVVFEGEMGAGKTTLITSICSAKGVIDTPSSPTFSLINEYRTHAGERIYHFDCYRIETADEAMDFGAEEYLHSGDMCLIEWGENIKGILPDDCQRVFLEKIDEQTRKIKIV